MNLNDLLGKHLQKTDPDIDKCKKSLEMSRQQLVKANSIFKMHIYDVAVTVGYNALFHSARALLFKDGYKDRSHWGIVEYLRLKYEDKLTEQVIKKLDTFRLLRHSITYGLESEDNREEAEELLKFAEKFLEAVEKLI